MTQHKLDPDWQARFKEEWRRQVSYDPDLTFKDKAVAHAALIDYNRTDAGQVGTTWNSQETLAEKMGHSAKSVGDSLRSLARHGYLTKVGRTSNGRGSVIYRFDLRSVKTGSVKTEQPNTETVSRSVKTEQLVGKNWTSAVQKTTHEQVDLNKEKEQIDPFRSFSSFDDPPPEQDHEQRNRLTAGQGQESKPQSPQYLTAWSQEERDNLNVPEGIRPFDPGYGDYLNKLQQHYPK